MSFHDTGISIKKTKVKQRHLPEKEKQNILIFGYWLYYEIN